MSAGQQGWAGDQVARGFYGVGLSLKLSSAPSRPARVEGSHGTQVRTRSHMISVRSAAKFGSR